MVTNAVVAALLMVPAGCIMTYVLHYNIEGLASSQCVGYTTAGVANIVFFMNADWEKAARKTQDISHLEGEGKYDDYGWKDLPKDAKAAAEALGYNQDKWDNDENTEFDFDLFTEKQKAAAYLLGYTRESLNLGCQDRLDMQMKKSM